MAGSGRSAARGDRVRVLAVGGELLEGRVLDRNTPRIAAAVRERGGRVDEARILPDDPDAVRDALEECLERGIPAVVSGGLGPTADDRTREGVAAALGRELEESEEWIREVRERPHGAGVPADGLRHQARLPAGARLLGNPRGTASAFAARAPTAWVLVLPGVPGELEALLEGAAGTFLDGVLPGGAPPRRRIGIAGVPESEIAHRLEETPTGEGIRIASYPRAGVVDLVLCPAEGRGEAELDRAERAVRDAFGDDVYEVGDRQLPEVVLDGLRAAGRTLAVAESCTGGRLGGAITSVPGASDVFQGGAVCYADRAKVERLGVRWETLERHGAVSGPVAREMAEGARDRFDVDVAVSVTGIAGPGGGTEEKPVGTVWIGTATRGGTTADHHLFPGDREEVRRRSVRAALDRVRRSGPANGGG